MANIHLCCLTSTACARGALRCLLRRGHSLSTLHIHRARWAKRLAHSTSKCRMMVAPPDNGAILQNHLSYVHWKRELLVAIDRKGVTSLFYKPDTTDTEVIIENRKNLKVRSSRMISNSSVLVLMKSRPKRKNFGISEWKRSIFTYSKNSHTKSSRRAFIQPECLS